MLWQWRLHDIPHTHTKTGVTVTHSFARLVLEDGWTRNQGFAEMMVVIGTFEGISDWGPSGSLWSDLRCYLNRVPHLSRRDKQMYAYKKYISGIINIKTGSRTIFRTDWCLNWRRMRRTFPPKLGRTRMWIWLTCRYMLILRANVLWNIQHSHDWPLVLTVRQAGLYPHNLKRTFEAQSKRSTHRGVGIQTLFFQFRPATAAGQLNYFRKASATNG